MFIYLPVVCLSLAENIDCDAVFKYLNNEKRLVML